MNFRRAKLPIEYFVEQADKEAGLQLPNPSTAVGGQRLLQRAQKRYPDRRRNYDKQDLKQARLQQLHALLACCRRSEQ